MEHLECLTPGIIKMTVDCTGYTFTRQIVSRRKKMMSLIKLDDKALQQIQMLIEANFTGRDQLYAAADALDDESRKRVCRRLAEFLAGNAAHLQQIVQANGYDPVEPGAFSDLAEGLFDFAKSNRGAAGVITIAEDCEEAVKGAYDKAIEAVTDREAEGTIQKQRSDIEFGECVLRSMQPSDPNP
jgi:uncharacterized protein (TIGR02284 family)